MPSLRGHHLVCLHFFGGDGYDQDFIDNLVSTLKAVENEDVHICSGADDICRSCQYLRQNTCMHHDNAEQDIRDMDETALSLLHLAPGEDMSWNRISEAFPRMLSKWYRLYCGDCGWLDACSKNGLFKRLRSNCEQ